MANLDKVSHIFAGGEASQMGNGRILEKSDEDLFTDEF